MVAARVGEPFGSLVLAVAVTIIEVSLIVALRASGGSEAATLARDTVFAAVVITMNGIAGLSLLLGSRRYGVTLFNAEGSGAALATLTTLATLALVLPTFTSQSGQRVLTRAAGVRRGRLVGAVSAVRVHPDHPASCLLPAGRPEGPKTLLFEDESHADPPSARESLTSLALLLVALLAVVGLAEEESPPIERLVSAAGFPH